MARTGSVCDICTITTHLSQAEATRSTKTVAFTVAWPYLVSTGSFRCVGTVDKLPARVDPTSLTRLPQMGSRTDIRNHYEIRGESTDDCLASLFCRSCALTQEGRELELEEKSFSS